MPRESGSIFERSGGWTRAHCSSFLGCEWQLVRQGAEAGHHHLQGGAKRGRLV